MTNILNWIDVGKVSAERDELLSEYFYDNGVLRGVIDNPSAFLVLGRKGAGKTAVFRYFKECYTKYLSENDILVPLSFEDYNWSIHSLLQNPEFATSLIYKQSWRFVIVIEVIKAFTQWAEKHRKTIPKPIQQSNKLLHKLFNHPIPSIYEIIGKKLLSLSKFRLPKGGLNLDDGSLDSFEINAGEVSFESVRDSNDLQNQLSRNIENLIKTLEEALESIRDLDCRIFLAFDRVDEAWDEISIDSSKQVIAGLVSAADSISSTYQPFVRPIIFLREDIFEVLSLNDANKLREDCGELLKWNRNSLFKLVLRRINYFASLNQEEHIDDIDSLFDRKEMRQRTSPSNYLLKRSMMRPRDLICFIKKIITLMNEKSDDPFEETPSEFTQLIAEVIYEAEPSYSEWLKQELIDEWSTQLPEITTLLDAIQNNGSTNITRSSLIIELEKLGVSLTESEALQKLRFLFDNSIIGLKLGQSRQWRYKCFYPSQGFIDSDEYRVHDGLVRVLNLTEPRSE